MATTKKSTAKKRKPAAKKPTKAQLQAKRELNAIILFALGVLLLLLAAIPGDNAWNTVHNVLRGLMGWCCYLMGPLMMIVAVLLTMDRTAITPGLKSASVVLMVLLLCGITHIIGGSAAEGTFAESIKALYRGGTALTGGGACAILFGVYPLRWLGRTGALIVDILLFFVFFMISTGTTLIGLFRGAAKPVKKLEEAYTAAVENRQAAAEAAEAAQKKNRRNFNIDVALEGEEKSPAAARKEALTKEGEASRRKVERLTDAMKVSTNTGRAYDFDSEPDVYVKADITSDNPDLQASLNACNNFTKASITYTFGDETETLDGNTIKDWLNFDEKGQLIMDDTSFRQHIADYVAQLAAAHDTVGTEREFQTTSGRTVSVYGSAYGWQIDQASEVAQLTQEIQSGTQTTREPVYSMTANAHGYNDIGNTYIEVDLSEQHMYFYQNGEDIFESDIVSGDMRYSDRQTPAGIYTIYYKKSPDVLRGKQLANGKYEYEQPVTYWMPFNGGIGFHDANWQPYFGGDRFMEGGSHGCINMPPEKAAELYNIIDCNIPIVCFY